jgi:hypothetical protein
MKAPCTCIKSIHLWHHDVEHNQLRFEASECRDGLRTVLGLNDGELVFFQRLSHEHAADGVVIRKQDQAPFWGLLSRSHELSPQDRRQSDAGCLDRDDDLEGF